MGAARRLQFAGRSGSFTEVECRMHLHLSKWPAYRGLPVPESSSEDFRNYLLPFK